MRVTKAKSKSNTKQKKQNNRKKQQCHGKEKKERRERKKERKKERTKERKKERKKATAAKERKKGRKEGRKEREERCKLKRRETRRTIIKRKKQWTKMEGEQPKKNKTKEPRKSGAPWPCGVLPWCPPGSTRAPRIEWCIPRPRPISANDGAGTGQMGYLRGPDFYWRLQFFWRTPALEDTKCVQSVLAKIFMGPLFQVTWIHVYFPNDFEKYAFAYPLPSTSCFRNSAIYVDVLHLILRWFHLHHLYLTNFDYHCLYGMWFLWRFPKSCYPSHPSHCQIPYDSIEITKSLLPGAALLPQGIA